MSYTPVIHQVSIEAEDGTEVARLSWIDEVSIQITIQEGNAMLTNSLDWPDLSAAIHAGLVKMEQSTQEAIKAQQAQVSKT